MSSRAASASPGRVARTMEWAQLPQSRLGSGDADGDRASKLQHAVERVDGDVHLGRQAPVRAPAHPPPVFHVLRTRNLDWLRPSPITCLNLPMAASARGRLV